MAKGKKAAAPAPTSLEGSATLEGWDDATVGVVRDVDPAALRPHPVLATLVPVQDEETLSNLSDDMKDNGMRYPIVANQDGEIIDGHTRWNAAKVLGWKSVPVTFVNVTPEQEVAMGVTLNTARRGNIPLAKRKAMAADMLKRTPGYSNREIARACRLTHPTVADIREKLEAVGEVAEASERTDKRGRTRKAKSNKGKKPAAPKQAKLVDALRFFGYRTPPTMGAEARKAVSKWTAKQRGNVDAWQKALAELVNLFPTVEVEDPKTGAKANAPVTRKAAKGSKKGSKK